MKTSTSRPRADEPVWPLHLTFSDGTEEAVATPEEAEMGLEYFDSDDPEDPTLVVDANGRPVRLLLEALQIIECRLK